MQTTLPANEIIERIQNEIGVEWHEDSGDGIAAGDAETEIHGVTVSVWPTLEVLRRAVADRKNLIVTHEPLFWTDEDPAKVIPGDRLAEAKRSLIFENQLVVFRLHDHWHLRRPDPFWTGLGRALGLDRYGLGRQDLVDASHSDRSETASRLESTHRLPPISLAALVENIERRMSIHSIRVVGDPKLEISELALCPGFCSLARAAANLASADALIVGECREWEGVEYVRDLAASGAAKAMIVLGHAVSEEPGMELCAEWLGALVPELEVGYVRANAPFWTTAAGSGTLSRALSGPTSKAKGL
ncbi:MAG TPA: Nif3-like dinuclear metal center hexameric protein [Solirubrobacterales bacterium]|nr:Nif3-like dinuclear metal center hexameric protein [Solirubrobacterales bacterium]